MKRTERRAAINELDSKASALLADADALGPSLAAVASAASANVYASLANGLRLDEIIDELSSAGGPV